jgi:hypothetical protein
MSGLVSDHRWDAEYLAVVVMSQCWAALVARGLVEEAPYYAQRLRHLPQRVAVCVSNHRSFAMMFGSHLRRLLLERKLPQTARASPMKLMRAQTRRDRRATDDGEV